MTEPQKPSFESSADPEVAAVANTPLLPRPLGAFGEGLPFRGVKIARNLVYRRVGEHELRLDIYRTESNQPRPCVVYIHGGGWRGGDKSRFTWYCEWLASEGFIVAAINYRLSDIAKYPAQIEDCQAAVRWIREHAAEYGIDAQRIAAIGGSSGAHLAALLALKRAPGTEVQAVVPYYGPHDLNDDGGNQQAPLSFIGATPEEKPQMWRDAKCTTHVSSGAPPMLLIHGDSDKAVPITQSQRLYEKLKSHSNEAEMLVVRGADHGLKELDIQPPIQEIDARVVSFLRKHLA